jgi:hypothetical protein
MQGTPARAKAMKEPGEGQGEETMEQSLSLQGLINTIQGLDDEHYMALKKMYDKLVQEGFVQA